MTLISLDVPDEVALLSSYSTWNEMLVGFVNASGPPVRSGGVWYRMFEPPLLKRRFDSVQAAIPYIERCWVLSVATLVLSYDGEIEAWD